MQPQGKGGQSWLETRAGHRRGQCLAYEIFMMVIESSFIGIKTHLLNTFISSGSFQPLFLPELFDLGLEKKRGFFP